MPFLMSEYYKGAYEPRLIESQLASERALTEERTTQTELLKQRTAREQQLRGTLEQYYKNKPPTVGDGLSEDQQFAAQAKEAADLANIYRRGGDHQQAREEELNSFRLGKMAHEARKEKDGNIANALYGINSQEGLDAALSSLSSKYGDDVRQALDKARQSGVDLTKWSPQTKQVLDAIVNQKMDASKRAALEEKRAKDEADLREKQLNRQDREASRAESRAAQAETRELRNMRLKQEIDAAESKKDESKKQDRQLRAFQLSWNKEAQDAHSRYMAAWNKASSTEEKDALSEEYKNKIESINRLRESTALASGMDISKLTQIRAPQTLNKSEKDFGIKVGEVRSGFKYKGGDPSKKENWEKVN